MTSLYATVDMYVNTSVRLLHVFLSVSKCGGIPITKAYVCLHQGGTGCVSTITVKTYK